MKHIEYLYRTLASKTDARFIDYQDETIYLYPKLKKKFLIATVFSLAVLLGSLVFFLFRARSFYLSDDDALYGFICLGLFVILAVSFFMVYRSRKHWILKIDAEEVVYWHLLFTDSIDWSNLSETILQKIKSKYSHESFISMVPNVVPERLTMRKKIERLFGFGAVNISDSNLPLPIQDLYDALVVYWHNTR